MAEGPTSEKQGDLVVYSCHSDSLLSFAERDPEVTKGAGTGCHAPTTWRKAVASTGDGHWGDLGKASVA